MRIYLYKPLEAAQIADRGVAATLVMEEILIILPFPDSFNRGCES